MDIFTGFSPFRLAKNGNNLTGQQFGRLRVISIHSRSHHKSPKTKWLCRCECGNWTVAVYGDLSSGHTTSCGCYRRDYSRKKMTTHNLSQSPEYGIFHGIKNRCENLNEPAYMHYGGRGIKCCFTSVMDLLDAIGERPSADHSVDRIDNDGHYEKGNVRWSTALEQSHNTRKNIALTINGQTKLLVEWHQELHLSLNLHTLYYRHYAGWCDACIVHNVKGQKCKHLI